MRLHSLVAAHGRLVVAVLRGSVALARSRLGAEAAPPSPTGTLAQGPARSCRRRAAGRGRRRRSDRGRDPRHRRRRARAGDTALPQPDERWVEGVYVFPLPENAAVDHLLMQVGERTIEGQIREREEAKAEYQQAKQRGQKASLVEQERPNLFTTIVANLGPGESCAVEIEYQQTLGFDEGEVRLRFPLVVAPRYIPGRRPTRGPTASAGRSTRDLVPDASRITPPAACRRASRSAIRSRSTVELDAGFPLATLVSRYHAIVSEPMATAATTVTLRDGAVPADRDFELAWTPAPGRDAARRRSSARRAAARPTRSLMLFPPVGPEVEAVRLPREMVFVIDTSGSMAGRLDRAGAPALALALDTLGARATAST